MSIRFIAKMNLSTSTAYFGSKKQFSPPQPEHEKPDMSHKQTISIPLPLSLGMKLSSTVALITYIFTDSLNLFEPIDLTAV